MITRLAAQVAFDVPIPDGYEGVQTRHYGAGSKPPYPLGFAGDGASDRIVAGRDCERAAVTPDNGGVGTIARPQLCVETTTSPLPSTQVIEVGRVALGRE